MAGTRATPSAALATRPLSETNEADLNSYARTLRARNRSARTIQGYMEALTQLAAFHDGATLADLKPDQITAYMNQVLTELSGTTAAIRFRSIRAFYNWAVAEDIIEASPMRRLIEPKVTERPVPVVDDDTLKALLKACGGVDIADRRDTAIVRLFCEPGSPRVAEMAGILITELDMKRDMVSLHGKGNKIRVIPFGSKTGTALDRYLRLRAKHPLSRLPQLWIGSRGGPLTPSGIQQMLERRCHEADIPRIHAHQLRHTSAHVWADRGGNDGDAMALFGWASSDMPRRYGASAQVERAQRASRRISPADRL